MGFPDWGRGHFKAGNSMPHALIFKKKGFYFAQTPVPPPILAYGNEPQTVFTRMSSKQFCTFEGGIERGDFRLSGAIYCTIVLFVSDAPSV